MGRPINKKYFGAGAGNQIKVRAKIAAGAEGTGTIVSQRGTKKFKVTVDGATAVCKLVNKSAGELAANEMTIDVLTDGGSYAQVTKLYNRVAIIEGNQKVKWTFAAGQADGAVQVADVESALPVMTIAIGTQPSTVTVEEGNPVTFTVTASGTNDLSYQWQKAGSAITGATGATYTISEAALADAGAYTVVISSASGSAEPVTSAAATLTVTPAE